ncbi:hypothetical protein GCM10017608_14460 [Agromyces luteolus]|uniref:DUF7882 family protein n=1 Tax=Agromyces luteolus TaxID=88373 RepID=UPI00197AE77C|nr:ATP-dependent DNA ligase [Agromyces luteolus]GLK27512.1 hypothetical protein GCM10017608_14460 [Agromyces luteolus]
MGSLVYDSRLSIPMDDRTLLHLQVVILGKLRRREHFGLTATVDGREVSLWLGPSVALEFRYADRRRPALSRAWLELLADVAASRDGLVIAPEPVDEPDERSIPRTPRTPPATPVTPVTPARRPARRPRPAPLPDVA